MESSTTNVPRDKFKRPLYLLAGELAYALNGNIKLAEPYAELNDDNHSLWAPITHQIPKGKPEYPIELQRDSLVDHDNTFLASVASAADRKYWWDRQTWETAQKICEKFQHHRYRHLFLDIDPDWKTPSFPPIPPRLAGPALDVHYSTLAELVSACQFYLWDLQRWEEDKDKQDTDIDTAPPSQSQDPELPAMANRKRESVATVEDSQRRKAPRRASQRRESYYANTWIPSDQLDPASGSEAGVEEQVEGDDASEVVANGEVVDIVEEDDEETIRLGPEPEQPPTPKRPGGTTPIDDLLDDAQVLVSSPMSESISSSSQESSQADYQASSQAETAYQAPTHAVADILKEVTEAVKANRMLYSQNRQRDLERQKQSIKTEARRSQEDSELRIAHMRKYGYSTAEIEWEEAKIARINKRAREDFEGLFRSMGAEEADGVARDQIEDNGGRC